jgi:hypothetical protein
MESKPRIATVQDPTIAAVVGGFFRFESQDIAAARLAWIGQHFIRAKNPEGEEAGALRLWISGFAVMADEKKQGFRGHYARLTLAAIDSGCFTLKAEKIPVELSRHPQKQRPAAPHPNWGHPVMRAVETGKAYSSITVARAELIALHQEFPEATIPGKDMLHVMVYNRKTAAEGAASPIQKLTIAIKAMADGGAKLVVKKKTMRKVAKPSDSEAPQGKFTTMIKQRQKKTS